MVGGREWVGGGVHISHISQPIFHSFEYEIFQSMLEMSHYYKVDGDDVFRLNQKSPPRVVLKDDQTGIHPPPPNSH